VISSLKISITNQLVGQNSSQIVVVKDIVCMFFSRQSKACKIQGVARALGVDRRNIRKAMERCLQLNIEKCVF
jgi:hypothetical protein